MNYTLNQLRIFLKVVKTQSVTKASKELNLTQPAVSIQLKNFQDQFEIPLTEIIGRKIYITDFGNDIAEAAETIINQVYAINYKMSAYKGQLAGRLKISVVSTGKYIMPFFLADFINAHSGVELLLSVTNRNQVIESLESNEVDLALVSILPNTLNIDKIDLLENKLYFVGGMKTVFSEDLYNINLFKDMPLIFRERGSATRQTMDAFLEQHKIVSLRKMELSSNEAVKQAVLAGLGYSIMPLIGIKNELLNKELQIIPIEGLPIKTNWSLIWLKAKKHSPVSASFLDYLNKEKSRIAQEKFQWYEQDR